ncbi:MAG: M23 family metallopeptidase [Bacillota bacterium]
MARKPRKLNKKFTIMVVPHSNSTIKSLKIPMWLINGLAIFGLVSLLTVTYLAFSYMNFQVTLVENEELKTVNSTQAKEIRNLQKTTLETLTKLEEITQTDSKIRELVGLKEPEPEKQVPSRSQGGPATNGRTIQTLTASEFDLIHTFNNDLSNNYEILNGTFTEQLDEEPDLNTIKKIKADLDKINLIIDQQKDVLVKLEDDVKDRLDYLAAIPSSWPLMGRLTDDFGWRRNPFTKRSMEYHEGIDIAASYGTPVKAAGAGRITFVGWKPAYGNTVIIKHGYGYVSQYAHNSKLTVKVGQMVQRGDIIARVGSTGRSTGPHVDFRIAYNGKWIDPLTLLQK